MEVPVQLAPLQALSDPQEVVGRITMIPLATGETIGTHHLADPTNYAHDLAFVIDDEQVLMAFPSTDLMSSLNILEPGDVVDILVSLSAPVLPGPGAEAEEGSGDAFFTFDAMQQVEISAVVVDVLTGSRSTSSVRFELSPVMAEYLRDRFELTVNR
jgi:Flp pilus assembly protein CpaB